MIQEPPKQCPPKDACGRCPLAEYIKVVLPCKQIKVIVKCPCTNKKCPDNR